MAMADVQPVAAVVAMVIQALEMSISISTSVPRAEALAHVMNALARVNDSICSVANCS